MVRLTNIIISVLVLALVVTGISTFMGGLATQYRSDDNLNETFVEVFVNESSKTENLMDDAKSDMLTVEDDTGVLDRLASFFRGGYDAAKALFNSFSSITRLINHSIKEIPFLGSFGAVLTSTLTSIALVILLVGILLHFLIKSDRT